MDIKAFGDGFFFPVELMLPTILIGTIMVLGRDGELERGAQALTRSLSHERKTTLRIGAIVLTLILTMLGFVILVNYVIDVHAWCMEASGFVRDCDASYAWEHPQHTWKRLGVVPIELGLAYLSYEVYRHMRA